jgi:GT2 family glycosyltransferase
MSLPTITLVTPSFNQAAFLEAAIRSVLDQGYPNLEYGIVDGGSTDGSRHIVERYREHLSFAIIEPDRGQAHAINKGLRCARSQVLGWLNSDDLLRSGALRRVGEYFASHPECSWLIGSCRQVDSAAGVSNALPPVGEFTLAGALLRPRGFNVPQPSTFWRRGVTDGVGLLDESLHYCMDFELWCRFMAAGHVPQLLREELSVYRLHRDSKSCAHPDCFIAALIDIERRYLPLLPLGQRLRLRRLIGYQRRALAVRTGRTHLWRQVVRHPWWLGSQQVIGALAGGHTTDARRAA